MGSLDQASHCDAQQIDALLARFAQTTQPGAAVGVAIKGIPVYRRGFGLANMELPLPLSPTTRMRIGSTTKHFVALLYMLFVEDGTAALEDPIGKYLPEFRETGHVTLRQLMGHIGGMRCGLDLLTNLGGLNISPSTDDQIALLARQRNLNFKPGHRWSYSNGSYALVSRVVEMLASAPLEQVLSQRIFRPLGMHDTLLRRTDVDFVPNSACLHFLDARGFVRSPFLGEIAGEGGIVSTVDDMLRWMAHMDRPVVGSSVTWDEMIQPMTLSNGASTGYGLGLMSSTWLGTPILHHPGGVFGGGAQMLKLPQYDLDIVVMVNRADADPIGIAEQIALACIPGLDRPTSDVQHDAKVGVYYARDSGTVIELTESAGTQFLSMKGMTLPAVTGKAGALQPPYHFMDLEVRFPLPGTTPPMVEVFDYGVIEKLEHVTKDMSDEQDLKGLFYSPETGVHANISCNSHERTLVFTSELTSDGYTTSVVYALTQLTKDLWSAKNALLPMLGGTLEITSDGSGFKFSTGRTTRLDFYRQSNNKDVL